MLIGDFTAWLASVSDLTIGRMDKTSLAIKSNVRSCCNTTLGCGRWTPRYHLKDEL